ncbi:MAG: hypothetical protein ACLR2E_20375 [Lachnospiraceae bacterium]
MYKVLIADDEVWIGFGIKKLIHKSGQPFTVIGEAPNGIRAYEMVKRTAGSSYHGYPDAWA